MIELYAKLHCSNERRNNCLFSNLNSLKTERFSRNFYDKKKNLE